MPRGDGTGPAGLGPMSGRGRGYCSGFTSPGFMRSAGMCFGASLGLGFGRMFVRRSRHAPWGYGYGAVIPEADERQALAGQAEFLEKRLADVKKRLSQLKEE